MKAKTKHLLHEAWAYCDEHDKSTAFMLQYMQDVAGVDLDTVHSFLRKTKFEDAMAYRIKHFGWPEQSEH